MSNPANASTVTDFSEFDFEAIHTETRKADTPVKRDVPANLVAMAQTSWDNQEWVILSFRGQKPKIAADFAETIKSAGDHTTPQTTILVKHDNDSIVVEFRATQRRGRKPGETDKSDKSDGNGSN